MKKITIALTALAIALSMAACSNEGSDAATLDGPGLPSELPETTAAPQTEAPQMSSESPEETEGTTEPDTASSILVAYFSRVGNTVWEDGVDAVTSASINVENGEFVGNAEYLARMAQEVTGGDLFLIQTVDTYPSDYRQTTDAAAVEQDDNARPALATHIENMDQYDIIVLIYPNWWGTLPQPLFTFLEEYDFAGKTILPLCTHEGSRMGSSERAIEAICPDAELLEGLSVRGSNAASAQSEVEAWLSASGILK